MAERHFDAIIIGAGQAGPPLAERLGKAGKTVAVVERDQVGGTCVNYGCIPTKALVANAKAIHQARRGSEFGFAVRDLKVDMGAIHARMKRISGESNTGVQSWLDGMANVTLVRGDAEFVGPRRLRIGEDELTADQVFLNVGGRARVPTMPGIELIDVLTNREMLELSELPTHLAVIGGSYIGLEFGQMFRRFGSEVTIIEQGPRLIAREDEDVSAAVLEVFESEGITVRLNSGCIGFSRRDGVTLVETDCGSPPVEASHVLLAVGRLPNTDTLGLAAANVEVDERGYVVVDDQLRTSAPGIWAMGDCNGQGAFTHTSWNDYEIVAANLLDDDPRRVSDRIMCYGLFVDPPLGRCGMTETQARASGRDVRVGKRPMTRVGRAREMSETAGFIKVVVDAQTEQILGAAILGPNGDEAIHSLLDVMVAGKSYRTISRAVHIHPTVSELIPTVLQSLEPADTVTGVRRLVAQLRLEPHPEGGYYRETWRSEHDLDLDAYDGPRSAGTSILFLLPRGVTSAWHRVASDELWLWQGGDTLQLSIRADDAAEPELIELGPAHPQALVPATWWQSATPCAGSDGYTLCGCIVVPGFDFADFEMQ